MKPGTKPKPTALRIMNGNPSKRPLNSREPKPSAIAPPCPEWLDDDAKAEWARLCPELQRMGLLTVVDAAALAGYCQAYADFRAAVQTLQKEGRNYTSDKGNILSHPAVGQKNRAAMLLLKFATEFGFTPSSRSRVEGGAVEDKSELDKFLA